MNTGLLSLTVKVRICVCHVSRVTCQTMQPFSEPDPSAVQCYNYQCSPTCSVTVSVLTDLQYPQMSMTWPAPGHLTSSWGWPSSCRRFRHSGPHSSSSPSSSPSPVLSSTTPEGFFLFLASRSPVFPAPVSGGILATRRSREEESQK